MKLKKFAAVAAALTVFAAAAPAMGVTNPIGVVASAAEAKLVTGTLDAETAEKLLGGNYIALGSGYYILQTTKVFMSSGYGEPHEEEVAVTGKIIRIGEKEIANWRSTGKLEPTTIESDIDLSSCSCQTGYFTYGDYILFQDHSENIYHMCKLDEASGKITKAYDITDVNGWDGVSSSANGYSFHLKGSPKGIDIGAIYAPTGKKLDTSSIDFRTSRLCTILGMEKYIAFTGSASNSTKIYGICPDGSVEEVYSTAGIECSVKNSGYGFVQLTDVVRGSEGYIYSNIILTGDGKEYKLNDVGTVGSVYGTTALTYTTDIDMTTWQNITKDYKLIDLSDNGKDLSKTYSYMATYDNGKTYLVQSEDGKWGYIDGKGKELAMFDDAGDFVDNSLYAPVVQDGKGWLVDKDMNQVSEKIGATGCVTMGEQLFRFTTADGYVLVTSPENGKDASAPTKPGNSGSSGNSTALTDKNSGVSVNGDFPSGTTLKVSTKKKDDNTYTIDITPVDANGEKVQPNGAAVVMAMIPELKGKTVNVYRVTDGKYTKLNSWVDGDGIFFTTTHFSEFEITTETRTEANPNTGSPAAVLGVIALAGAFAIVSRKKR